MLVPVLTRRAYDFSSFATTSIIDFPIVRYLDVLRYRSGELRVRVHDVNIASGRHLFVSVFPSSPSVDNPALDFWSTTALAEVDLLGAVVGQLLVDELTDLSALGSHVRVSIRVQPTAVASRITGTISAALSLREKPR